MEFIERFIPRALKLGRKILPTVLVIMIFLTLSWVTLSVLPIDKSGWIGSISTGIGTITCIIVGFMFVVFIIFCIMAAVKPKQVPGVNAATVTGETTPQEEQGAFRKWLFKVGFSRAAFQIFFWTLVIIHITLWAYNKTTAGSLYHNPLFWLLNALILARVLLAIQDSKEGAMARNILLAIIVITSIVVFKDTAGPSMKTLASTPAKNVPPRPEERNWEIHLQIPLERRKVYEGDKDRRYPTHVERMDSHYWVMTFQAKRNGIPYDVSLEWDRIQSPDRGVWSQAGGDPDHGTWSLESTSNVRFLGDMIDSKGHKFTMEMYAVE